MIDYRSFSSSLTILTCMSLGAFWSCSSSDGSPISPPDVIEPPDASPQDAGTDAPVKSNELTVVALTPANGDTNVSVQDPIQVTFSERVKIGPSAVTLATPYGTILSTRVILSSDQRTITISPVAAQKAPAELVAHFGDVSTLDGRRLASSPDWSWKLPAWLRVGSRLTERFKLGDASVAAGRGRRIALVAKERGDDAKPKWTVSTVDTLHGTWTQLGDPLSLITWEPHLLFDPSDNLVLSSDNTRDKIVQRWSGTGWNELGAPIRDVEDVSDSPLAIDANGRLLLACSEGIPGENPTYNVIVRAFDASGTWSPIGGPVNDSPTNGALHPRIAVDPAGVPYLAYTDPSTHVRKWTGSAWVPVGASLATTSGDPQSLGIAFDDDGRLFAVGSFWDGTTRVIRFDGSDWVPVGEPLSKEYADAPSIVRGHNGHIFATVYDNYGGYSFRVADITKAGWTMFEPSIQGFAVSLTVDSDNVPLVISSLHGVLRPNL